MMTMMMMMMIIIIKHESCLFGGRIRNLDSPVLVLRNVFRSRRRNILAQYFILLVGQGEKKCLKIPMRLVWAF